MSMLLHKLMYIVNLSTEGKGGQKSFKSCLCSTYIVCLWLLSIFLERKIKCTVWISETVLEKICVNWNKSKKGQRFLMVRSILKLVHTHLSKLERLKLIRRLENFWVLDHAMLIKITMTLQWQIRCKWNEIWNTSKKHKLATFRKDIH